MIGEHHGHTGVPARSHVLHHHGLCCRIQPGERLIENQQRRVAEQGLCHGHLLAGALGQLRKRCVSDRGGTDVLQELGAACHHNALRHASDPTEVSQVLARAERQARRETLRHVTHLRWHTGDAAAGGHRDPGQNAQQRALPAAVPALQVDQRARGHAHLDVAQHPRATSGVPLIDPLQPYLHGVRPAAAGIKGRAARRYCSRS